MATYSSGGDGYVPKDKKRPEPDIVDAGGPFDPRCLDGARFSEPAVVRQVNGLWKAVRLSSLSKLSTSESDTRQVRGQEMPLRKAAG